MTRYLRGLSAVLAVGLGGSAVRADSSSGGQMTLMQKLFGPKQPKPGPTTRSATPARPITVTAPLKPEVVAEALRAEQEAYLRRVAVCTELRRVAVEKGDNALLGQADELERQASALYNARVMALGVSRAKAPLPETAPESPTDPQASAARLTAPSVPPATGATARLPGPPSPSDEPFREVKP